MMQKILLVISWVTSSVFFIISVASLYTDSVFDGIDAGQTSAAAGFVTPWFTWSVDPSVVYMITACLCLVTARITYHVFDKEKEMDYLYIDRD